MTSARGDRVEAKPLKIYEKEKGKERGKSSGGGGTYEREKWTRTGRRKMRKDR